MTALFIRVKDIMRIEDYANLQSASKKMKKYFERLGKKWEPTRHNDLSIGEYVKATGIKIEDVKRAMG